MNPILSVVIVNYNTRDLLRACLVSLYASTLKAEIIVVDNASKDDSAAMIKTEFPEVKLLTQVQNTWYCGGNNIGIDAAQGEYVLLLNPDTVVGPDALEKQVDFLRTHPEYAGCTARLVYPDGTVQRTCSRIPTYLSLLLNHTPLGWLFPGWKTRLNAHQWYADWHRDSDKDVEVIPGSCLLMRREDIRLDGDLLLYFPEDDIARRIQRPFRFIAAAQIEHHEKSVTRSWLATRVYFRDMLVYTRKHYGWAAMLLLWLLTRPVLAGMRVKSVTQRRVDTDLCRKDAETQRKKNSL